MVLLLHRVLAALYMCIYIYVLLHYICIQKLKLVPKAASIWQTQCFARTCSAAFALGPRETHSWNLKVCL